MIEFPTSIDWIMSYHELFQQYNYLIKQLTCENALIKFVWKSSPHGSINGRVFSEFEHCTSVRITDKMKILTVFGFIPTPNDPPQKNVLRSVARISQQIFLVMLIIPSVSTQPISIYWRQSCDEVVFKTIAMFRSIGKKDMDLTLRAFYYLAIQFYITSSFFSSVFNTHGLRQLFHLLEEHVTERKYKNSKRINLILENAPSQFYSM